MQHLQFGFLGQWKSGQVFHCLAGLLGAIRREEHAPRPPVGSPHHHHRPAGPLDNLMGRASKQDLEERMDALRSDHHEIRPVLPAMLDQHSACKSLQQLTRDLYGASLKDLFGLREGSLQSRFGRWASGSQYAQEGNLILRSQAQSSNQLNTGQGML